MNVEDILMELKRKAGQDPAFLLSLLETEKHPNSLTEFCRLSTEAGFPLYEMDLIEAGEAAYAVRLVNDQIARLELARVQRVLFLRLLVVLRRWRIAALHTRRNVLPERTVLIGAVVILDRVRRDERLSAVVANRTLLSRIDSLLCTAERAFCGNEVCSARILVQIFSGLFYPAHN